MSRYSAENRLKLSARQTSNTVDCFDKQGRKLSYAQYVKLHNEGRGNEITTVVHGRKQTEIDIPAGDTNAAHAAYSLLRKSGYSNEEMGLNSKVLAALNGHNEEEDQGMNF